MYNMAAMRDDHANSWRLDLVLKQTIFRNLIDLSSIIWTSITCSVHISRKLNIKILLQQI